MSDTTSDWFVKRLKAWGATRVYGYPGDGINGVLGAVQRGACKPTIQFIQVRHEEMAAFMATGHAKFTGELGVSLSTGGPGATHLITGLYVRLYSWMIQACVARFSCSEERLASPSSMASRRPSMRPHRCSCFPFGLVDVD